MRMFVFYPSNGLVRGMRDKKQVAQWATIAHHGASIMFEDTTIYNAQRQVTLNLKHDQKLIKNIRYYASSSYLQVLKGLNMNCCRDNLVSVLFSDAQGQLTP